MLSDGAYSIKGESFEAHSCVEAVGKLVRCTIGPLYLRRIE